MSGAGSPCDEPLLTVTVVKDEHGYGMKVSGDNPVYVQSVKEHGAAWRAGLRAGDRILKVDSTQVQHHSHQQVVQLIRANPSTVLTVHQNASRHRTPITAPVPVNPEKQRQLEWSKVHTFRLMLEKEQKFMRELKNSLAKVPDVRKQAMLESTEQRCYKLQQEIDNLIAGQPPEVQPPSTPRLNRQKTTEKTSPNTPNTGFLSGLPRSLSNLTGQSLRNLRQARQKNQEPLQRQNSDDTKRRHVHNNTVPMVPTTCLDNSPPPLPPRSMERRNIPPLNPLANPKPGASQYKRHTQMPVQVDDQKQFRRSMHCLDGVEGPQPNSIALQMSYPLVNVPPPPLQMDNRTGVPVLHVRSQSSPEHLDRELAARASSTECVPPPPGTPPPPYRHNTQPCADPQRAIISMEEDDSPTSENSAHSGLFSNLMTVRESKVRTAVILNWLLGERRSASAVLVLVLTDYYRSAGGVSAATLRRWAYEIHSTFLMPSAELQLSGVDENMANDIEHVLINEYDKDEILRNVFRKARQKAKEVLSQQLSEFQVKRQVGLGALYGPDDAVLLSCDRDTTQEQTVVERLLCERLRSMAACGPGALAAAAAAAAACLGCRPAALAAALGGARASFLLRDKHYKQRVKQLAKQNPQPFIVRGHHLQLQAATSVCHCHHCDLAVWGLAPQAYVCTDCKLRVHIACARQVEEGCCLDGEHHHNRISRFMERIHQTNQLASQDSSEKKTKKAASANFLNMERSFRKIEDEQAWDSVVTSPLLERRDESDESLYESADGHSDAISASDDALPRLSKTPTMSKESLKLAVTDEEVDVTVRPKKGHRKALSLSNPLEIVKNLGDEWFESRRDLDKHSDKKKSRESLFSEEDRDSVHGSSVKLDQVKKTSKKDDKNTIRKGSADATKRKSSKGSDRISALFLRRKKTPASMKTVEAVAEAVDKIISNDEILNYTKFFLEAEKLHSAVVETKPVETDSDDEPPPTPRPNGEQRRRLSRQTSRSKSKIRGKSQSVKVNTLRKSHSGTLKKNKKKGVKTPLAGRSRQASIVEPTPLAKKKNLEVTKHNSWLFNATRGESRREGSTEDQIASEADVETTDAAKDVPEKDSGTAPSGGRAVSRAESCRSRVAPRRGKQRNASDPNRLTAHNNHDLEPGAATAPSGSSSSSSLSSRSYESNTVAADHQASQSDLSEEDEPLAENWADSLPPQVLDTLLLSARHRKRQEFIHELIVSEGSHVRWLKVLGVFYRALESQPSLLPAEELRALFPNLPGVRERHNKLYAELRSVRGAAENYVVGVGPVADAVLNTLGESGYASCLSRFCRGQRLALDALRERRQKSKELRQLLNSREQLPVCGRLQLQDLLACVWQRLTKYQLLLEGILKTMTEECEETATCKVKLQRALDVAKTVLHSVNTSIRTAENEQRLRTIQSKLEVRVPGAVSGSEWEELKRVDLSLKKLRMEGDLTIRSDNKKMNVLALMLEDSLILLQREGDKFILKPIAQLSPLIKWDKVLFRPNAAVKNTFFLMNINGVQMHELSANSGPEYASWVKHIQEAPLAKLTELKPIITPSHQASRSTDDSGINVSRNPSDASEKSTSSTTEEPEGERVSSDRERVSLERDGAVERSSSEREREDHRRSVEKDELLEKHEPRRIEGTITYHTERAAAPLARAERVRSDVRVAETVTTAHERLRRLDEVISSALRDKSAIVGDMLGVPGGEAGAPGDSFTQLAELAVADTLGQVDVRGELQRHSSVLSNMSEDMRATRLDPPDVNQLLLAAQAQANQLTEALSKALAASEGRRVQRASGRCAACRRRPLERQLSTEQSIDKSSIEKDTSFDMLRDADLAGEGTEPPYSDFDSTASELATQLIPLSSGIQSCVSRLLQALQATPAAGVRLDASERAALAAMRERSHANSYHFNSEISFPDKIVDQNIQDQPTNGG